MFMIKTVITMSALLLLMVASTWGQSPTVPDWVRTARVAGLSIQSSASANEITIEVTRRKNENVSVIELDTSLSHYLSEAEFQVELNFIQAVVQVVHQEGLKVVIYYPALEVITPNGETAASSMYKDHPDWVQVGLGGVANVFYGSQEDWVEPGAESAWMSPNSPYRQYFIERVRRLAQETDVDGIWVDVPIYLDTGAPWSDVSVAGAQAFRDWSVAKGYGTGAGLEPPTQANFGDPTFRLWLRWRHENLATFIEDVRVQALQADPNFVVGVETYPMDYMDTVWTGLDPAFMTSSGNFFRIWEVDSVSNTLGMKWSSIEDFSNKIAMYKWGRALDRDKPSWTFVYGNEPLDTSLTLGAAVATQNSPFETKTPIMTQTVSSAMRTDWYGFIRDNEEALLKAERLARVGVWFSSPTREYQDMPAGAQYGMYLESVAPSPDPDWWAVVPNSSLRLAPHLGGWRGAAHALHQLAMPYKVISTPGTPAADMQEVSIVWLPSVGAMSDAEATALKQFVQQGGTVLATGLTPATLDELGNARTHSALDDLFGFGGSLTPGARMHAYGQGVAIYRPSLKGLDLFVGEGGNSGLAERTLGEIEQILRIHTPDDLIVNLPKGVFVELSAPTATEQHLYIVNYSGAQQPLVSAPVTLPLEYRAPEGFEVISATVKTPDANGQSGNLPVLKTAFGVYAANIKVDQFALVTYQLAALPAPSPTPYTGLTFATPERQDAVQAGLNFILTAMRDGTAAAPYRYGVRTNLFDNNSSTDVYTGGHHVTAEHMGLLLRVSALLNDDVAFQGAYEFVRDVLYSKGYHVVGWSMHKQKLERFLQADELHNLPVQFAANAPLDDLRVIHGLLAGGALLGLAPAEALGHAALNGLYWTTVTDRRRGFAPQFPTYPGGLLGISWDWEDQDDATLTPPAVASGLGRLGTFPIPVDYQDLETMSMAAQHDPRWKTVLTAAVALMLDAEIPGAPGLFYNGLGENGQFTGDFEYQEPGQRQGQNLKVIQELWTALHLKRVSRVAPYLLDETRRSAAAAAAQRSYDYFKTFYQTHSNRIPEYLSMSGTDVPNCGGTPTGSCLAHGEENLFNGEARIYAQLARLALLFDDDAFAAQVIDAKLLTDRITDPTDARYGMFGVSTSGAGDAEAWNTLESLLTLALEAAKQDSGPPPPNTPPVALADSLEAGQNTPLSFTSVDLLANDTDADGHLLALQDVDTTSAQGATIALSGTRYIYTPTADFLGDDTFTYTVSDGFGGQASATVTVAVVEGGGGPTGFVMDGDLADWPPNASQGTDADDITGTENKLDLLELFIAHDATHLYIAYRNDGPVFLNWGYTLYLDTDQQATTGFGFWEIGAEYVIEGPAVFQYAGTGTDWTWTYIGDVTMAQAGHVLEFAFPRAWIGNPPAFDFIFYGDNAAYTGGSGIDLFPDNVDGSGTGPSFITYLLDGAEGNQGPTALAQTATTTLNTAVNIVLQGTDPENDPLTYQVTVLPLNGTLSGIAPNLTYTPNAGITGVDSFIFIVNDGVSNSNEATVNVIVSTSGGGIFVDGSLAEWPAGTSLGTDPDDVAGTENKVDLLELLLTNDATNVYVGYVNDGPVLLNWAYTLYLDVDRQFATGFQFWDIGADYAVEGGSVLKYTGNGTDWQWQLVGEATLGMAGNVLEYSFPRAWIASPTVMDLIFFGDNAAYAGGSAIDYVPDNATGAAAGATFLTYTFQTAGGNQAPVAMAQNVSTPQDTALHLTLQASDPNQDPLTWMVTVQPTNGALSGTPPALIYTPNPGYSGADQFAFKVNDGQVDSNEAVVTIAVTPVTPSNRAPVASGQTFSTVADTAGNLTLQASDPDNDPLTWTLTALPANGTLSGTAPHLTYTPNPGYTGTDAFRFMASDGLLNSNEATVDITVTPPSGDEVLVDGDLSEWPASAWLGIDPNDMPDTSNIVDLLEILITHDATNVYVAYRHDGPFVLDWRYALYLDTDQQSATGFQFWDIGADYLVEGSFVYRYTGTGSDWSWASAGSLSMAQSGTVLEYAFPKGWIGDPLAMNLVFYGNNTATLGASGVDLFPDNADGSQSGPRFATYRFETGVANQPPTAITQSVSAVQDTALAITLQAVDPNNDALIWDVTVPPVHGTLSGTAPDLTYIPDGGYTGPDQFAFIVNDGTLNSNEAFVDITVLALADGIVVDGALADWSGIQPATDPQDIPDSTANRLDITALYLSSDNADLYVAYQNEGPIELNWAYSLYLDTDAQASSGFHMYGIGAEYLVQGQSLYRYTGDGTTWQWTNAGNVTTAVNVDVMEQRISLVSLGQPVDSIRAIFVGDNTAYAGGNGTDLVPDGASGSSGQAFLTHIVQSTP